ncbi:MAG: EAL domain-containing protein [Pseudomonadota bacterium]
MSDNKNTVISLVRDEPAGGDLEPAVSRPSADIALGVVLDSGQIGFWVWDLRSDAWEHEGYWTDKIPRCQTSTALLEITHPDDIDAVSAALADFLRGKRRVYEVAQRVRMLDGSYRRFLTRGQASRRDSEGRVLEMVGTHTDVTEQYEQRALLELALDSSSQGVWAWDIQADVFHIQGFDSPQLRVFALPARMSGEDFVARLHPDNRAEVRAAVLAHLQGNSPALDAELRIVRGDNAGYGDFLVRGKAIDPLEDGRFSRIVGTCSEITARKEAERKLALSLGKLKVMADALTSDESGRLLNVLTKAAVELAGADCAFVARTNQGEGVVSACYPSEPPLQGLVYPLAGTPCESVPMKMRNLVAYDVARKYPRDALLQDWDMQGYSGRALLDVDGKPIGVFALMFRDPITAPDDVMTVQDILASRAAAELEREVTHTNLRANEERLNAAIDSGEHGVWEWLVASDSLNFHGGRLIERLQIDMPAQKGVNFESLTHPGDRGAMVFKMTEHLRGHTPFYEHECRLRARNGEWLWVRIHGRVADRDAGDKVSRVIGTVTDIQASKKVQLALERSQQFLELVIETVPQGMYWQDREGRYLGCNERFAAVVGADRPQDIIGKTDLELEWGGTSGVADAQDLVSLSESQALIQVEREIVDHCGRRYWAEITKVPMLDPEEGPIGVLGAIQDISDRKRAEQDIQQLALYDPLTNLPNRRYFTERLEEGLAAAKRRATMGALLFIDMDQFKQINDTLGHTVGDGLLQAVAQRLQNVTRQEDTVARLGGDEFVVLLPDVAARAEQCAEQARRVADKIHESLGEPFQVDRHQLHVTPTIGVSLFPEGRKGVDEVLREADTAMYSGKAAGRNVTRFFQHEMEERAQHRLTLELALRTAIENNEMYLCYQPQLNRLGEVIGAEVLLRWSNPELGEISPVDFIPIAEERGLIVNIGWWVLETAFATFKSWLDSGVLDLGELSINVSSRQFRAENFVENVEALLIEYQIPPRRIVFELTEGTVVEDVETTINVMQRLRRVGIRFSIDDFGTGYSSLSYLKRLPIDQLKIDRSFISDIGRDSDDEVICQTIIAMSKNLGLHTIAEGVETQAQVDFLSRLRCEGYQGFLFSKPCQAQEFVDYCESLRKPVD